MPKQPEPIISLYPLNARLVSFVITLIFVSICIGNVLYNWHYFKQYDDEKTAEYYWAYQIWYASSCGSVLSVCATIMTFLHHSQRAT
jgi:hypothetical protein